MLLTVCAVCALIKTANFWLYKIFFGGILMSSAGTSSPLFLASWTNCGYYRIFQRDFPDFLVAVIYRVFDLDDSPWVFEPVNCSDDFRPPLLFVGGPLAEQHSYPLDITVLTDTDDLPF